jgi:hypothetical protein
MRVLMAALRSRRPFESGWERPDCEGVDHTAG